MSTIRFSRQRILTTLGALAFVSIAPALTDATVVYDTTGGATQAIDQQTGDNNYYIGDTATIVPTSEPLTTISIVFGSSSLAGPAFTYTPDLMLDLYPTAANAAAGTGLFGSATVNNVTFTNDGVVGVAGYNYEDEQLVTFDFTSQDIVLPTSFAFAYHDAAPLDSNGSAAGANGLSVGLTAMLASPGVSDQNYFYVYPDSAPPGLLEPQGVFNIEAQVSVVPEPTSASVLVLGGMALLARRRRRAV